jgi:glycosyltransferase involved in cell wall biosynthesis
MYFDWKRMVTVVILSKNEADNLAELLPTLSFADKILVIDDDSTDATADICARLGAERIVHALEGDYAQARNFGLKKAGNGWVLFLDADERLPQKTIDEILGVVKQDADYGYVFRRADVFYGKKLRWGDTGSVRLVRLGKASLGSWEGKVHEVWQIEKTKEMEHEIIHYAHESAGELFDSINRYALIRAKELADSRHYWNIWEQLFYPPLKFMYLYFRKLGMLDGWRGLVMSIAMAWHSFLVRWYLWDLPWKSRSLLIYFWRITMVMPVLLLPFGQLQRGWLLPIYVHELFMMLSVIVTSLVIFTKKQKVFVVSREYAVLMGLSAVFGVSFLASIFSGLPWSGGLQLLRWYLYVAYLFSLLWGIRNGLMISIAGMISYYATLLLGLGWLQYVLLPDVRFLSLLGWDDHYYRMVGSLFDPNFLGLLLLLIALWALLEMKKLPGLIISLLSILSLAATFSRASWLTFMLIIVLYAWWQKETKKVLLAGGAVMLLATSLLLLPRPGGEGVNILRQYSLRTRIESWSDSTAIFLEHPVLGIGFNQYGTLVKQEGAFGVPYHPKSPDNSFLFVLATSGVMGMGFFLWMLIVWWRKFPQPVMRLSLMAILIHSMANNSFFYPFVLLWWWLLMAYQHEKVSGNN